MKRHTGRRRRRSNVRQKRLFVITGIVLALILAVFLSVYFVMRSKVNKVGTNMICNNVYIETIDVSGMSKKKAKATLAALIEEYQAETVKLVAETSEADVTLGELGFSAENADALIEEAVAIGKKGSIWSRYQTMKAVEKKAERFEFVYAIDKLQARTTVSTKIPHLENQAKDATIRREDGAFIITDGVRGKKVDLEKSIEIMETYFNEEWESGKKGTITLATTVDEPDVTREQLEQIQSQLGTYSTSFAKGTNRGKNVENATGRINGTVLLPGEEMSASEAMGETTAENGYFEAGSYLNGKTVQSFGGGVCQVSSTLYNAVILSELEVTERWAHSMTVGYVKPSMDAAIAEGYKDLKFKNNLDAPIYIEGYTKGSKLTFTIYGKETRSEAREIAFVSEVISRTEAKKKFVASGDAVGTLRETESGHAAIKAKLWKVVTENGTEVSRTQVNSSSYISSAATWSVGTATDHVEAKKVIEDAITTQDEAKIKAAIAQAQQMIAQAQQTVATPVVPEGEATAPSADGQ